MKEYTITTLSYGDLIKKIIEKSKNLFLIAVASTLIASVIAFLWGLIKTLAVVTVSLIAFGYFGGKD